MVLRDIIKFGPKLEFSFTICFIRHRTHDAFKSMPLLAQNYMSFPSVPHGRFKKWKWQNFRGAKTCNGRTRTANSKGMNLMDFPLSHVAELKNYDRYSTWIIYMWLSHKMKIKRFGSTRNRTWISRIRISCACHYTMEPFVSIAK